MNEELQEQIENVEFSTIETYFDFIQMARDWEILESFKELN